MQVVGPRKIMKRFLKAILLIGAGVAVGVWLSPQGSSKKGRSAELEQAQLFKNIRSCAEPTSEETKTFTLAADMLEQNLRARGLWLDIGVEKFLAHGLYRTIDKQMSVPVCAPQGVYSRAGKAITKRRGFRGHIERYQLELAARISDPSPYIVEKVGKVAFSEDKHVERKWPYRDIRPLARSVLANYGKHARKYLEVARAQMSDKDSLGTSASQIAVVAGDDSDLSKVEKLMRNRLASIPQDRTLSINERNRLYELAHAFVYVGTRANSYIGPVKSLMTRKVKSNATMFGLVDLSPKQMCHVLEAVGDFKALAEFAYCKDPKYPYP
jgi:hypothetical protein